MKTFLLEIITPDRIVFSNPVSEVIAPSSSGEIGILPEHVPLFTKLTEGEVRVIQTNGDDFYLGIGSGFMEVTPKKTSILVTSAYKADELNEKEIMEAIERAKWEISQNQDDADALKQAQEVFIRSTIALKVLSRRKKTPVVSVN